MLILDGIKSRLSIKLMRIKDLATSKKQKRKHILFEDNININKILHSKINRV